MKEKKTKKKKRKKIPQQFRFDQPKMSIFEEIEESLQQGRAIRLSGVKLA